MNLLKSILVKLRIKKDCENFIVYAYETGYNAVTSFCNSNKKESESKLAFIGMVSFKDFTDEEKYTLYKKNNLYKTGHQCFFDCETGEPHSYNKNPMVYSLEEIKE